MVLIMGDSRVIAERSGVWVTVAGKWVCSGRVGKTVHDRVDVALQDSPTDPDGTDGPSTRACH